MTPFDELRIRAMTTADMDAVIALERASDRAPHWGRAEYLKAIESPVGFGLRRMTLIAEVGGMLAGFTVVRLLTVPDGQEAELEAIVVAGALRRRGIATALIAESLHRAKAQGARRLDLEVRASNAGAMRLYERAGLSESGRREHYYCNPDEDAVLMSAIL